MLSTTLIVPVELSDDELDSVAAASGDGNCCQRENGGDGGTTVQFGVLSAQADDGSNAGLMVVGNQSA
jgi:hypothetical protein